MAIYLFFLLFWFGINTVHKRLLEMIFLFLFRKKNLEADVCGVINGLDLGGAAMCVGRGDGSAEGSHIVTWALIQGGPQASDAGFFFSYFIPSIPFLFIVYYYIAAPKWRSTVMLVGLEIPCLFFLFYY